MPRSQPVDAAIIGKTRDLHWWSGPVLVAIADRLRHALLPWSADWDAELAAVDVENACECSEQTRSLWRNDSAATHHEERSTEVISGLDLGYLLFGADAASSQTLVNAASACCAEAQRDFRDRLVALFGDEPDFDLRLVDHRLFEPWSGGVVARIDLKCHDRNLIVRIALDARRVQLLHRNRVSASPAPRQKPKVPWPDALQGLTQKIQVQLDAAELSIGQLQSLRVDDLIVTPHRVDRPVNVWLATPAEGRMPTVLCQAHLGARRGFRAVELLGGRQSTPRDKS